SSTQPSKGARCSPSPGRSTRPRARVPIGSCATAPPPRWTRATYCVRSAGSRCALVRRGRASRSSRRRGRCGSPCARARPRATTSRHGSGWRPRSWRGGSSRSSSKVGSGRTATDGCAWSPAEAERYARRAMGTISTCARPRHLVVVGAGLAGCEAAWQAGRRGVAGRLDGVRPSHAAPAHTRGDLAELVCSNSLRSNELSNAVGLLKEEMRRLGSLVMAAADRSVVPAGRALAVDRALFARHVSQVIESHPRIELRRELVAKIPDDDLVVLASGPLTAPELAGELASRLGASSLYFYDAISPIVYADSIDPAAGFRASRWQDGPG